MKATEKLKKIILLFLLDEAKPRNKVTNKLKNYPKENRDEAIKYVMENKLVSLFEIKSPIGRNPVMIKLTTKGLKEASSLNSSPVDKTVWSLNSDDTEGDGKDQLDLLKG